MKAVFLSDFLSDAFTNSATPPAGVAGVEPAPADLESAGFPSSLHPHSKERNIEAQQGHYLVRGAEVLPCNKFWFSSP